MWEYIGVLLIGTVLSATVDANDEVFDAGSSENLEYGELEYAIAQEGFQDLFYDADEEDVFVAADFEAQAEDIDIYYNDADYDDTDFDDDVEVDETYAEEDGYDEEDQTYAEEDGYAEEDQTYAEEDGYVEEDKTFTDNLDDEAEANWETRRRLSSTDTLFADDSSSYSSSADDSSSDSSSCNCSSASDFLTINNYTCLKTLSGGHLPKEVYNYYPFLTDITLLYDLETKDLTPWYYWNPALQANYFVTESAYTSTIIISNGTVVIFDTGLGVVSPFYDITPTKYRIYYQLEEMGCADAIDYVVISHMHRDDNGWDVNWKNDNENNIVPTFPNAQYMIQTDEYNYWISTDTRKTKVNYDTIFAPLVSADVLVYHTSDYALNDYLTVERCVGHTPGHQCLVIKADDKTTEVAILTGDVMHHPVQVQRPEWSTKFDINTTLSVPMRDSVLDRANSGGLIVVTAHFASPYYGKVVDCWECGGSSGYVWSWL